MFYQGLFATSVAGIAFLKHQRVEASAEEKKDKDDDEFNAKEFFMKNVLDYKDVGQSTFKIPQLLQEREAKKREEYQQRAEVEVEELGLGQGDVKQMKELDFMYGGQTTQEELEEMEAEEEAQSVDPKLNFDFRNLKLKFLK